MVSEFLDSLFLSIIFTGIVLTIVEAGILTLILKSYQRKNSNLTLMFVLTFLWGIFLVMNHIGHNFNIQKLILIAHIFGIIPIVVFASLLPRLLKFFNKPLLIFAGMIATTAIVAAILSDYFFPNLESIYRSLLAIPPFLSYILFMEATIRKLK